MERLAGVEPATHGLEGRCYYPTELQPHIRCVFLESNQNRCGNKQIADATITPKTHYGGAEENRTPVHRNSIHETLSQ